METTFIDPALCHPNRYQPADRIHFTPDQLTDLESIREKLLMPPKVRPHPEHPGEWEICYGHRRTAAWKLYRPGELMPAYVENLSDFDLFAEQAIENGQRQNLNAIDKALTVQVAMKQFGKTQLEAGKLVGLTSQSAVSHLLSLLRLPESARVHVAAGTLPERIARQLVKNPRAAEIADIVAGTDAADKDRVFSQYTTRAPVAILHSQAELDRAIARELAKAEAATQARLAELEERERARLEAVRLADEEQARKKAAPRRKEKPVTHKSAHARKPPVEKPPLPPKVRKEIAAMAQAAASQISSSNPQRGAILKAIESLCRRWKVGLPKDWAGPAKK